MSSGYSDREEHGESGGWKGKRQGGFRGRGNRDYGQSSYSGSRREFNHNKQEEQWSDGESDHIVSNDIQWKNRNKAGEHEDRGWEESKGSRGRGFGSQNRYEDSRYQRQDKISGGGDQRGGSRGRGFNLKDKSNYEDNDCNVWEDSGSRNERESKYHRNVSNPRDNDGWGDDFNKLSIKETDSGRGKGYNRQSRDEENSYQRHERTGFGGGDEWEDNTGGGSGRGFRNDGDGGSGGWEDNEDRNNRGGTRFNRRNSRGGTRFGNRDDGDQSEGRRTRGSRGGGAGSGFRGNEDGHETRGIKEEGEDKPRERYVPPAPADDEETVFSSSISSGNNFSKYDNIPVKVSGDNVPKPVNTFEECNFNELLLENIRKSGYTKPTPVQKHALPAIATRRDVMGCAQTGSGKTAAFLLPIINALLKDKLDLVVSKWVEPEVIICSPTRELAQQIFNEARKFAFGSILKIAIAYGGTSVYHQASRIAKGCHILVATPGRLNDFVNRGKVKFTSCRFFVLDEADRMLDMGFLPAIEQMLDHETMTPKGQRQTLMFSATFPDDIQRLAANYLHEYLFLAVGIVGGACSDVEQNFHLVPRFEKKDKLIEILSTAEEKELTLVFVEKQRTADFIAAFLSENNFPTTSIHGARLQSQRELALADFKSGRMPTLVATAVAARGLDIKNVTHVVNFDMPSSVEEYVHRIGRTGRVGNRGKATSFYDSDVDGHLVHDLTRILQQSGQVIPTFFDAAKDAPSSVRGGRRSENFGGQDFRGGEDNIFISGPAVVHVESEERWCVTDA